MSARRISLLRILGWLWIAAVVAAMGWGWAAYAGPYRLFAEWQLAWLGAYYPTYTFLIPALLLAAPALGVALRPSGPQSPVPPAEAQRRTLRGMILAGVACLAVAAGFGAYAWREANREPSVGELALSSGREAPPPSDLVRVTGVLRAEYSFRVTRSSNQSETYTPLVPPGWKPGQPIGWFVLSRGYGASTPPPAILRRGEMPGSMTTAPGVAQAGALPGMLLTPITQAGLAVDVNCLVL